MAATARVGVDIGGTFTDLVLADDEHRVFHRKVSSTPAAPEEAVLVGVEAIVADAGLSPGSIREVVHGTTVGSNTLLQKLGAATGLITTKGFRDVLEIGRLRTPEMFDLQWEKPATLVPRRFRREVTERIAADGAVLVPLDEDELLGVARELVEEGIASIAICFINSYRNPAHERRAHALLAERFPDLRLTASVSVLPEAKEYERTSTTVVNAYVGPVLERYLARLEDGLKRIGVSAPLLVSNSNGALASSQTAREKPVFFISSGRAAGVVGGGRLGAAVEMPDLVVFDMGGTTASASLIQRGELARVGEYEFRAGISTPSRFIKAGGYMMSVPTVDVAEVGSGAGSIAFVDEGGLLRVGPISAGAVPGPACYGRGGGEPTVTDANLVLGYLPATLAGGERPLDAKLAREAIGRRIGERLRLSPEDAAFGIREVVNANMARAIRAVTVERGVDPREFALMAIGGSGPVHAADIARLLSIPRILVPASPGVFTAMGMLAGDIERYFIRPLPGRLQDIDVRQVGMLVDEMRREAEEVLRAEGSSPREMSFSPEVDMRFRGQETTLSVPLKGNPDPNRLWEDFLTAYRAIYSYSSADAVETVSVRLIARGARSGRIEFRKLRAANGAESGAGARRNVYFGPEFGWTETPILERRHAAGTIPGPAILEGTDSTVAIPPDGVGTVDALGNLLIAVSPARRR
jgi:N-methylhydantoinase A